MKFFSQVWSLQGIGSFRLWYCPGQLPVCFLSKFCHICRVSFRRWAFQTRHCCWCICCLWGASWTNIPTRGWDSYVDIVFSLIGSNGNQSVFYQRMEDVDDCLLSAICFHLRFSVVSKHLFAYLIFCTNFNIALKIGSNFVPFHPIQIFSSSTRLIMKVG